MKLVKFHPEAAAEVSKQEGWYRARSEVAAQVLLLELDAAVRVVAESPERWPLQPRGERRYLFPGYPFALLYRIRGGEVFSRR